MTRNLFPFNRVTISVVSRDQPADMEARRLRVVCSLRTCTTAGKPIPPACDSVARSFVTRIEPQLLAAVLTATIAAMADNGRMPLTR